MELYGKLSRLFTSADLNASAVVELNDDQFHYFKNVLRKKTGDTARFFNGRDGEWLGELDIQKKSGTVRLAKKIRDQPAKPPAVHLLFAPIKKNRTDILIEKSVELGVTHLHPVATNRADARAFSHPRIAAQVLEAAEQCERMDAPELSPLIPLKQKLAAWDKNTPVIAALERFDAPHISEVADAKAFLIGPEGGFDENEVDFLTKNPLVKPVSLGESVLRAETAAFLCLGWAKLSLKL